MATEAENNQFFKKRKKKKSLKCSFFFQIVLSVIVTLASAAPQFLADTPEVNAAKAQFFSAYNQAFAASAPTQQVADAENSPNAISYVHEDIEAEPYIHVEIPAEPYIHQEGPADDGVVPVAAPQQAAAYVNNPVFSLDTQAYNGPVQQSTFTGGCYNWKGEGVPCRTTF
jgi:hypothetical protein